MSVSLIHCSLSYCSYLFFVLDAYMTATTGMQAVRRDADISAESIDDVMEAFAAELELQNELAEAVSSNNPFSVAAEGDSGEQEALMAELEQLMMTASAAIATTKTKPSIEEEEEDLLMLDLLPDMNKLTLTDPTPVSSVSTSQQSLEIHAAEESSSTNATNTRTAVGVGVAMR